jgi:hypothetical protein
MVGRTPSSARVPLDPLFALAGNETEPKFAFVFQKKFRFEGLEPGAYKVYVVPAVDKLEYRNPEVLESLKRATSVSVRARETTRVVVTTIAHVN